LKAEGRVGREPPAGGLGRPGSEGQANRRSSRPPSTVRRARDSEGVCVEAVRPRRGSAKATIYRRWPNQRRELLASAALKLEERSPFPKPNRQRQGRPGAR